MLFEDYKPEKTSSARKFEAFEDDQPDFVPVEPIVGWKPPVDDDDFEDFESYGKKEKPAKQEKYEKQEKFDNFEEAEDDVISPEELALIKAERRQKRAETAAKIGKATVIALTVLATVVAFVGFLALNLIPAIVKSSLYIAGVATALFGKLRYTLTYGLRMVFYDGKVTASKRKKMVEMRNRTLESARKIKASAKKIRLLSFGPIKNSLWSKRNGADEDIEENFEEDIEDDTEE